MLKNTKIAISPQRFYRSLRNLVQCCRQNENNRPHERQQSLKTEPRIKRAIGYILCKVHMCGKWPVLKYKHIKMKPIISILSILCLTWTVNAKTKYYSD